MYRQHERANRGSAAKKCLSASLHASVAEIRGDKWARKQKRRISQFAAIPADTKIRAKDKQSAGAVRTLSAGNSTNFPASCLRGKVLLCCRLSFKLESKKQQYARFHAGLGHFVTPPSARVRSKLCKGPSFYSQVLTVVPFLPSYPSKQEQIRGGGNRRSKKKHAETPQDQKATKQDPSAPSCQSAAKRRIVRLVP